MPIQPRANTAQMENGVDIEENLKDDQYSRGKILLYRQGKDDIRKKHKRRPEMGCFGRLYESQVAQTEAICTGVQWRR